MRSGLPPSAGQPPAEPPSEVLAWAERTADAVRAVAGSHVTALYLHGSAVLGGWSPRSDVDVLAVAGDGAPHAAITATARCLARMGASCPGRGLESSVVSAAAAARAAPPWIFLVHVATGPGEPAGGRIASGRDHDGDRDLLMHYAVCRAAGLAALGPPPRDVIGEVARTEILGYLADELCWGLEHAPEPYAVLNACRALIYLSDGQIVSKITGGLAALSTGAGPAEVISRALAQQQGHAPVRQPGMDAVEFVLAVTAELTGAADFG